MESGELRWVGQSENVAVWVETKTLAVMPSGNVTCVQLVEVGL